MKVLVVGAGEMGRWFARTLRAEQPDTAVAFADADPDVAAAAAGELDARAVGTDTTEGFALVCIAVPIPAVADAIEAYADNADRAMVDVSGVMTEAVSAMAAAAPDCERVSFHPLFAAANAPGNVAVVPDAVGTVTDRVRAALTDAGNDLFETTAQRHDRSMETVQARTHAAVLAFGLAAESVDDTFQTPVSAALFDALEQVTGNDPGVYADIQTAFEGAEDVADAARRLADADRETFERLYDEADAALESGGLDREDGEGR